MPFFFSIEDSTNLRLVYKYCYKRRLFTFREIFFFFRNSYIISPILPILHSRRSLVPRLFSAYRTILRKLKKIPHKYRKQVFFLFLISTSVIASSTTGATSTAASTSASVSASTISSSSSTTSSA